MSSRLLPDSSRFRFTALLILTAFIAAFAMSAATPAQAAKQKRIVALTPFAANAMGFLGAKPVAVGEVLSERNVFVPVIENGLRQRKIKSLTLTHPNGPNLEQLAKLRPDIVFSSSQWAKGKAAMRALGIRVVDLDPVSVGQIYGQTRRVARVVGKPRQARSIVRAMRRSVALNTRNITKRPKVMVILGVGRTPFTFLKSSWGGRIVRQAGGNLLTGGASGSNGFARISDEVVIAENPDVIIAVPHAVKGDISEIKEYMLNNPAWESTTAVQEKQLFISTDSSLLQAGVNPGGVIRKIRAQYLKNR